MSLTFFIVYHDKIYEETLADFKDKSIFTYYGVKKENKIGINETELERYDPKLQVIKMYNNSAFFHLYWNREYLKTKYIGFGQYDMIYKEKSFNTILENLKDNRILVAYFPHPFSALGNVLDWSKVIQNYNSYYNTQHSLDSIKHLPLCLIHAFIIPTDYFLHIMPWVEHLLSYILRDLEFNVRHLAGCLERVFALAISCGINEKRFNKIIHLADVEHSDSLRLPDDFRKTTSQS